MFGRAFDQETVDDDGGQRCEDQDIAYRLAAFQTDLSALEEQVADPCQQEHLKDLFYKNEYHGCPRFDLLPYLSIIARRDPDAQAGSYSLPVFFRVSSVSESQS